MGAAGTAGRRAGELLVMSTWVLVLALAYAPWLKTGVGIGVTSIDMPSWSICEAALDNARKAATFQDGFCVSREVVGEK